MNAITRLQPSRQVAMWAVAITLTVLTSGCETSPTATDDAVASAPALPSETVPFSTPQVRWSDEAVSSVVFGRPVVVEGTSQRPMRVTQPVSTTTSNAVVLRYRFEFRDAAGATIAAADPHWQSLVLAPGQPVFMEGRAAMPGDLDYEIELDATVMR